MGSRAREWLGEGSNSSFESSPRAYGMFVNQCILFGVEDIGASMTGLYVEADLIAQFRRIKHVYAVRFAIVLSGLMMGTSLVMATLIMRLVLYHLMLATVIVCEEICFQGIPFLATSSCVTSS